MRIENTKTGVNYYTRTAKQSNGFASIVVRQQIENGKPVSERLAMREIYFSRGRAYRSAIKACEVLARNHAYFN